MAVLNIKSDSIKNILILGSHHQTASSAHQVPWTCYRLHILGKDAFNGLEGEKKNGVAIFILCTNVVIHMYSVKPIPFLVM